MKSNLHIMSQNKRDSKKQIRLKKTQMKGTQGVHSIAQAQAQAIGGEKGQEGKAKAKRI